MSFYSSLLFYRPSPPPIVTPAALREFVESFDRLGLTKANVGLRTVQMKFGKRIDADAKPTSVLVPKWRGSSIHTIKDIDWDVDSRVPFQELPATITNPPLRPVKGWLRRMFRRPTPIPSNNQPLYRAWLELGGSLEEVCRPISELTNGAEFGNFRPYSWSLRLGVIELSAIDADDGPQVGWLALSFSGTGYLGATKFEELRARVTEKPSIRAAMELCRQTWPVETRATPPLSISDSYFHAHSDSDWSWGLNETG